MKKQLSKKDTEGNTKKVKAPKAAPVVKPQTNKQARTEANKARRIEKDRKLKEQAEAKQRRHLKQRAKQYVKDEFPVTPEGERDDSGMQRVLTADLCINRALIPNTVMAPDDLAYTMLKRWRRAKKLARTLH